MWWLIVTESVLWQSKFFIEIGHLAFTSHSNWGKCNVLASIDFNVYKRQNSYHLQYVCVLMKLHCRIKEKKELTCESKTVATTVALVTTISFTYTHILTWNRCSVWLFFFLYEHYINRAIHFQNGFDAV